MHEIGLCEGVLAVALDAACGEQVTRVRIRAGQLQGVVPEVFSQGWEMVSDGTGAAGSRLELYEVPARVSCRSCGEGSDAVSAPAACRSCGSQDFELSAGDELVVEEVEVSSGKVRRNPDLAMARKER